MSSHSVKKRHELAIPMNIFSSSILVQVSQIRIARISDPSAVWQVFLTTFDDYMVTMKNKHVGSK